jgi:hypothetical protein
MGLNFNPFYLIPIIDITLLRPGNAEKAKKYAIYHQYIKPNYA